MGEELNAIRESDVAYDRLRSAMSMWIKVRLPMVGLRDFIRKVVVILYEKSSSLLSHNHRPDVGALELLALV
jgi:hypothetical protein